MAQAQQWAGKGLLVSLSVRLVALTMAADPTIRGGPGQESMNLCSSVPSCPAALAGLGLAHIPAETQSWEKNKP